MEGSVTIWLPEWYKLKTHRHPYQRTYRDGMLAKCVEHTLNGLHVHLMPSFLACRWEKDDQYCVKSLLLPSSDYYPILVDVMDSSVFDFLMGIFFFYKRN